MSSRPRPASDPPPEERDERDERDQQDGTVEDSTPGTGDGEGEAARSEGDEDAEGDQGEGGEEVEGRQVRAPWHFKVIVVGSVVYLGYRLYQGISWLAHHL